MEWPNPTSPCPEKSFEAIFPAEVFSCAHFANRLHQRLAMSCPPKVKLGWPPE
jgi:hypothetical protein